MDRLDELLAALMQDPHGEERWLVLSDWLEEHDDPRRAELLRLHRQLLATCREPEQHPERTEQHARLVELLGQGVRPCVPQRTVMLDDGVQMTFSFIPPGTFLMGSPETEPDRSSNEVQHWVTLSSGFFLSVHPVTQPQWRCVMGSNPSHFTKTADLPVDSVSWEDCQKFCRELRKRDGHRYRLPTEAEWEYACRAGTTTPFSFGATLSTDLANYDGDFIYGEGQKGVYRHTTTPGSRFPANAWGLTDMHGNLWERCQDWSDQYPSRHAVDPQGPPSGQSRVLRGGSWGYAPQYARSACRWYTGPQDYFIGCRIVCCLD